MAAKLVKSDLFRRIWLSEQFLYQKKYQFNAFEFSEREIHAFVAKLSDRCFCWFPAADSRLYLVNGFDFYKPRSHGPRRFLLGF